MTLPRNQRMGAHDMLKIVREQCGRLLETAPSIPEHVIKEFQHKFIKKYPDIAIPDIANGLRAIKLAPTNGELGSPKIHLPLPPSPVHVPVTEQGVV